VVLALAAWARWGAGLGWSQVATAAAAGFLTWTFVEYVLHRWFFHTRPRTPGQIRAHFLAHGIHHLDPRDATRLVFPPLAGAGIALVLYALFEVLLPTGLACAFLSGLLAGYLAYDMSHYASHHMRPREPWLRYLSRYHQAHHHRDPDALFGVSSPLWDLVFRTGSSRS
jgi:sterol desaturase/sphingolipid hydroxylase (fatty acid hydroxylase superfamily)